LGKLESTQKSIKLGFHITSYIKINSMNSRLFKSCNCKSTGTPPEEKALRRSRK
jgi:hypothetical protein